MGKTKGRYEAEFPVGSLVRIVERAKLELFAKTWKYHHPLDESQLQHAGETAEVAEVNFYHGGDELYTLNGVPGVWHESCLENVASQHDS